MSTEASTPAKPSNAQLAYLHDLCEHTGTDFVYPGTARNARRVINDLKALNARQEACRARFLTMVSDTGLPTPDEAQHEGLSLRFVWNDRKVMVIIDLDDIDGEPTDTDTPAAVAA
jgi:hypothetical protein